MGRNSYSRSEKNRAIKKAAAAVVFLAVMAVALGLISRIADHRRMDSHPEEASTEDESDILEINGVRYKKKKDIMTYLFIGTDTPDEADTPQKQDDEGGSEDGFLMAGQSDVLQIVVLNRQEGTYTRLPINRETMAQVHSLDEDGTDLGTTLIQLEFAHSQGDGKEISCENTVEAVSSFLYGQMIDHYCCLSMGAIQPLNHLAGGVDVTIEDDFSRSDPSLIQGETVHLTDEQAQHFVHDRMSVGDGTNEGRMRRQNVYLTGLKPVILERCREDSSYALDIYDVLEPYMVTDMSRNDFIKLAARVVSMDENEPLEIQGSSKTGEFGFSEFTADEDSLAEVVVKLFYDKEEGE